MVKYILVLSSVHSKPKVSKIRYSNILILTIIRVLGHP